MVTRGAPFQLGEGKSKSLDNRESRTGGGYVRSLIGCECFLSRDTLEPDMHEAGLRHRYEDRATREV